MDTSSPLPAGTVTIYYTYDPLPFSRRQLLTR